MRTTRFWRVLLGVLVTALLVTGVPASAQDGDPFPRTVTDATGARVVIPAYPARVALLGTVPALDQLVPPDDLLALDAAREPDAALWDGVGLLVLPVFYASAYPAWVVSAEAAGVPVVQVGTIASLAAWRDWLAQAGYITGRERAAQRAIRRLEAALWIARVIGAQGSAPRVLVLTPEGYTVGQGALLTELIAQAGGVNAAAAASYDDYRQLTDALVRDLAPDVVLLTPAWGAAGRDAFRANAAYADLPAVQSGRVCSLPFGSTQIDRPGAAALWLALLLHGGAC